MLNTLGFTIIFQFELIIINQDMVTVLEIVILIIRAVWLRRVMEIVVNFLSFSKHQLLELLWIFFLKRASKAAISFVIKITFATFLESQVAPNMGSLQTEAYKAWSYRVTQGGNCAEGAEGQNVIQRQNENYYVLWVCHGRQKILINLKSVTIGLELFLTVNGLCKKADENTENMDILNLLFLGYWCGKF